MPQPRARSFLRRFDLHFLPQFWSADALIRVEDRLGLRGGGPPRSNEILQRLKSFSVMKRTLLISTTLFAILLLSNFSADCRSAEAPKGVQLFYRLLGAQSNGPLLPKTRTICAQDGAEATGQTGMADSGFTEYPFCAGKVSYTCAEQFAFFPRIASGVPIDSSGRNVGDILIDHVYEPDAIVWGLRGREFVQTFVASGRELVSLTMLVPSEDGMFLAALLEGGPGGRQIGRTKSFHSGHSMDWGHVTWLPGEAPLELGRTYALRLTRADGQDWSPYLHATGNCYDDGILFMDGRPRPESDLGAWIIEEPPDLSRALIVGADYQGWVYNQAGVVFEPRTPNVRLITITASPVPMNCCDLFLGVWTDEATPRLVAGPKRCLSCGPTNGPHTAHFLFGADELPVEPGKRYRAGVLGWTEHRGAIPEGLAAARPRLTDMQAIVYGEPHPGGLPAIHNLKAEFPVTNRIMRLSWSVSWPCPVKVEISRRRPQEYEVFHVEPGTNELTIPKLWPGHEYDFRLEATGQAGLTWRTPLYRLQIPNGPFPAIPRAYPKQPDFFVPIAGRQLPALPAKNPMRYRTMVPLVNGDFEEDLNGWTVVPADGIYATREEHKISPPFGKKMAGWSQLSEQSREQVFAESMIYQTVPTVPGHVYALWVRAHTSVVNGPRGDTRVRLFADSAGGTNFAGQNTSQWYWTDGRWSRFQHRWIAEADQATIGFGFFRWRDLERATAYVDHAMVFDLGPTQMAFNDPPISPAQPATVVLQDRQVEFDQRVEAELTAPPNYVVTGLGARAHEDNITTIWMQIRPLLPDGTLGPAEELRGGWEPDAHLEAQITLPEGYVATGFGGRIAPEWDVKTFALWGRPLLANGALGTEKMFRAGIEPNGGLEKQVQMAPGRVLTTAGMNCGFNDMNRIKCASMALVPTASAKASR